MFEENQPGFSVAERMEKYEHRARDVYEPGMLRKLRTLYPICEICAKNPTCCAKPATVQRSVLNCNPKVA